MVPLCVSCAGDRRGDSTAQAPSPVLSLAAAASVRQAAAAARGGTEAGGHAYLLHLFLAVLLLSFLHKDLVAPFVFALAFSEQPPG